MYDSAPLLPITDSVLLSTKADGVLVLARAPEVSHCVVRQACERLAYVKVPVLGVVLNNIGIQSPEYKEYRSSYIEYYTAYAIDSPSDSLAKTTDDPRPEAQSLWARARRRSTD
jgi:Mrp family chromosome partitioning ATPase